MSANRLFFGDNLDILGRYIPDESVDLVYLDPPFKSNQDYNVLFAERDGSRASAQIKAFEDTWRWDSAAVHAYQEAVESGGRVADALQAFRTCIGENDMLAYLSMMAPRLKELRRVLQSAGSLYLHCDPTSSHYLKVLLDAVFGPTNFRGEIAWKRTSAHSDTKQGSKQPGRIHDVLLFHTKDAAWTWNPVYVPFDDDYVKRRFKHTDGHGSYKDADLSAARPGGDTLYEWRIRRAVGAEWVSDLGDEWMTPKRGCEYRAVRPPRGRYWAYSRENMVRLAESDRLHYFSSGTPRLKQYADELAGITLQDVWADIPPINAMAAERLGYPTQKPEALLERILQASTNEGDIVLDPFCGCGTTIAAAERMKRRWLGIDITHLAIGLIRHRLRLSHGDGIRETFGVVGEPVSVSDAEALVGEDPFQFQCWALGLVGARPAEVKKGGGQGDRRPPVLPRGGGRRHTGDHLLRQGREHRT